MKVTKFSTIISYAIEGYGMPRSNRSGFTLIELMITIAVLAVLAAIALPSFKSTIERRQVIGAAENLQTDLQYARSEAIKQNKNIFFQFDTDAWCYGIDDTSSDCDCSASPADCTVSGRLNVTSSDNYKDVVFQANNFSNDFIVINPRQGMVSDDGQFIFTIGEQSKSVSVNLVGRISLD